MENNLKTSEVTFKTGEHSLTYIISMDEENKISLTGKSSGNEKTDYGLSGLLAVEFFHFLEELFKPKEEV